jgi:hypothetical protein
LTGLSEVKCTNKELFHVPNFDNIGNFDVLDLRKNHIQCIPVNILKKFALIDIRENKEFDCEKFRNSMDNIVYPVIVSDCKDVHGFTSRRPTTTELSHWKKKHDNGNDHSEIWSVSSTPSYVLDVSTKWMFENALNQTVYYSKFKERMNIYMIYGIILIVALLLIIVAFFCGKRILNKCRIRTSDQHDHNILEEEEEETSFSLPELTRRRGSWSTDNDLKQE